MKLNIKLCLLILTIFSIEFSTLAAHKALVISGGDNPGLNHYSQYLQTKLMYHYTADKFGSNNVEIYFGAGNNNSTKVKTFDVHSLEEKNKDSYMISGIINNNSPATKQNISNAFYKQNLKEDENLFLFISDHGLPNLFLDPNLNDKYSNNCINLWNFQNNLINNFANKTAFSKVCLSKNELNSLIEQALSPHQYTIFEMSQCYSGGFHQMSVTFENGYPRANGKICGFTSAPPDHYASGCTPDASGTTYQGYERYFTEWYTGKSVVTGEKLRNPSNNILEAHENALLEDMTVDIPLSTSNYYLWQWANLFDKNDYNSRIKNISEGQIKKIYYNYKDKIQNINDPHFLRFRKLTIKNITQIIKKYPEENKFPYLPLEHQKEYILKLETLINEKNNLINSNIEGIMNLYLNIIMPQWKIAIESKNIFSAKWNLTDKQRKMENDFYSKIVENNLFQTPQQQETLFLQYLSMNKNDTDLLTYHKNRNPFIKHRAFLNKNSALEKAIDSYQILNVTLKKQLDEIAEDKKKKQLLKRIYIYHKILAAWTALIEISDKSALTDLQNLLECEQS